MNEDKKSWWRSVIGHPCGKWAIAGFVLGIILDVVAPPRFPNGQNGNIGLWRETPLGPKYAVHSLPPTSLLFAIIGFLAGLIYVTFPWKKSGPGDHFEEAEDDGPSHSPQPAPLPEPKPQPSLDLSEVNAEAYCRDQGLIGQEHTQVEPLAGGVSNQVIRIITPIRAIVLKQSRPQLRTREAWFSDVNRVFREQEVMESLRFWLPETVPEVLFVDRRNHLFAMTSAPLDAKVWKQSLLEGHLNLEMGEWAGLALGRMHQATADSSAHFLRFADPTVFMQLRVDPFYRRIMERVPEVAIPVGDLIEQMLSRQDGLCHGDYTPKNMLVHGNGFLLVDYETAYFGDPAMDLGLFLAHLFLKAIRRPQQHHDYALLLRGFWRAYLKERTQSSDLEQRGQAHLGACLLARIDGTSPVDYLPEESKRQAARQLGLWFLHNQPNSWAEGMTALNRTLLGLQAS